MLLHIFHWLFTALTFGAWMGAGALLESDRRYTARVLICMLAGVGFACAADATLLLSYGVSP